MTPLISVIIPNYNHAQYLKHRIDSVLVQTFQDIEVIILDDCSTDNSRSIIEEYKNHALVSNIIFNEVNSGNTFKQWNKGISLAKGTFIWIAESDDYANPEFLKTAISLFTQYPDAGLFFCDFFSVDETGVNVDLGPENYLKDFLQFFDTTSSVSGRLFCEKYLFFSNSIVNASGVVFKKNIYKYDVNIHRHFKITGDWCTWVDICYATNILFSSLRLNYYRQHTENVRSKRKSSFNYEVIKSYIRFTKKAEKKYTQKKIKDTICKYWIYSVLSNKRFITNFRLFVIVFKNDVYFPIRLGKRFLYKITRPYVSDYYPNRV